MQMDKLKEAIKNPYILGGAALTFSLLALTKRYFNGGVCKADRDLTGKVIVITGGNSGLGKATIQELYHKKCIIIFGARDVKTADQFMAEIKADKKVQAEINYYHLDLSDLESIDEFSENVKRQVGKIDILVNNAATFLVPERRVTKQGFEMQMGINYFGHFYLTQRLWPLIKKAHKPRVINISSIVHRGLNFPNNLNIQIPFDDMQSLKDYDAEIAYGRSKAGNILFTKELQRRMDEANFQGYSYTLHPGIARTAQAKDAARWFKIMRTLLYPILILFTKNGKQACQTHLYTILEDESKLKKGAYYADCKESYTSQFASNMNNARKLWEVTEQILGITFNV